MKFAMLKAGSKPQTFQSLNIWLLTCILYISIFNYNPNHKPKQFGLVWSDKISFFFFFQIGYSQRREIVTVIPFVVILHFLLPCYFFPGGRRVCTFILASLVALGQNNLTLGSGAGMCIDVSLERICCSVPLPLDITSTNPVPAAVSP